MNKGELVSAVAAEAGLTKTNAETAVNAVFSTIRNAVSKGQEVRLIGFGTFAVTNRAASTGRNPRTGEAIKIPAKKQVKFKAGKDLKESVNKK